MTKDIKRGLRNPLDEAQVRKAVVALQLFLEKQKNEHTKKELVETTEYLSCIITRKNIPSKSAIKPIQMYITSSSFKFHEDLFSCFVVIFLILCLMRQMKCVYLLKILIKIGLKKH